MNSAYRTCLLLAALGSAIALAMENEPSGFRGIAWQTPFAANAAEMTLLDKSGDDKLFVRKGDKMSIGAASLDKLQYAYWRDMFSGVYLGTKGSANKNALIDAFKAQFGTPRKPNEYLDKYLWKGETTIISLDCNSITNDCTALIISKALFDKRNEVAEQAARDAKKDF